MRTVGEASASFECCRDCTRGLRPKTDLRRCLHPVPPQCPRPGPGRGPARFATSELLPKSGVPALPHAPVTLRRRRAAPSL